MRISFLNSTKWIMMGLALFDNILKEVLVHSKLLYIA